MRKNSLAVILVMPLQGINIFSYALNLSSFTIQPYILCNQTV